MEQMKEKKFAKRKHLIGSIILLLAIAVIIIPTLKIYADTVATAIVEDEKTIVRTSAALSRGENTDSIVDINTLPTFLNKYAGSGATSVAQASAETISVTFASTGNIYYINIYTGPTFDNAGGSTPYLPTGYTPVEGTDLTTGFVIEDSSGNQFVWVEVPRTPTVYPTAGLNITTFTQEEYNKIEADLHTYTSTYRNGTSYTDTYYSDATTGLTQTEYNAQKKKMLKSIYKNGGFYVGRYETGIADSYRTAAGDSLQTPVIKQNAYPYNWVTVAQAQGLSESFSTQGYNTSLMFGVQWDLVLKYLETKGTKVDDLKSDSTSWGNYKNTVYNITNTDAKYSSNIDVAWTSAPYNKTEGASIGLTTGASDIFSKQNISDLAGNLYEWTLEQGSDTSKPCAFRGGYYYYTGSELPANYRGQQTDSYSYRNIGFRVALYKDYEIEETPTYIPTGYTHVAGTDMDTGYVVEDSKGNQYVWVEVPRTTTVYPTAGLLITEYTTEEFVAIETDLKTYTSVYRNGTTFADEYYSDAATGLTQTEYNNQKKKMLMSIYKNGGFYVGRYETGIADSYRTAAGDSLQTPVIKQNAYPYNFVTNSQAQELSESFATTGYTSSLMFGVQWDLVLKYLETKGTKVDDLKSDSTSWGNYNNNTTYNITNSSAKYYVSSWVDGAYGQKASASSVLLSTGADSSFCKQGIYDLAGNLNEWILEYTSNTNNPCVSRGGGYDLNGYNIPASHRGSYSLSGSISRIGFRVALYTDETIPAATTYTITYNANMGSNAPAAQTATVGVETTLSTTAPSRLGYTFLGWATTSTSTTAEYAKGASYTGYADVTLYAVWQRNTYTVTLNANGGNFGTAPEAATDWTGTAGGTTRTTTVEYGKALTIPSTTAFIPTRTNYTFLGWGTSASATTATYVPEDSVTITATRILYAVWQAESPGSIYTITLNANGGYFGVSSITTRTITVNAGESVSLSSYTPTKPLTVITNNVFKGWALTANSLVATYSTTATITPTANMTLYAVWGTGTNNNTNSSFSKLDMNYMLDINQAKVALVPKSWTSMIFGF